MTEAWDINKIATIVGANFGNEFALADHNRESSEPPLFTHQPSGLGFRYIPGGVFSMGLSDQEETAARNLCDPIPANLPEMRPVHELRMMPFLMAERPVLMKNVGDDTTCSSSQSAAYLSYDEAIACCDRLGATLPSEAQWEYACRAGSNTLFTWGNDLPDGNELAGWMKFDFAGGNGNANASGLHGLFVGEWCSDTFTSSYEADHSGTDAKVIRGGGALFWPWQDREWVWCMSAMRMPSTDLIDNQCGCRPVRNLPADQA